MIEGQTPRGWYDVGGGFAGMWDGQRWTGERISHHQLQAMTGPPPPAPPPAPSYPPAPPAPPTRRQIHPVGWLVLIVLFIFIGLPIIAAFMQGFSTGLNGR